MNIFQVCEMLPEAVNRVLIIFLTFGILISGRKKDGDKSEPVKIKGFDLNENPVKSRNF